MFKQKLNLYAVYRNGQNTLTSISIRSCISGREVTRVRKKDHSERKLYILQGIKT